MEYKQGENVNITVKNNLDNSIKHLKGAGCGLQGFSSGKWTNVLSKSCKWDGEDKLKPNSEYNFSWTASESGLEKYRIAFHYQEQELMETKKIGKIICENKNLPDELEKLLLNGMWIKNDVEPCVTCLACGCSCTVKNVWSIGEVSIGVHYVSCGGNSYTVKYKNEEYNCVPENYKPLYEQASIYPKVPEGWETIYSNEFTIKEKSALDVRCEEKVKAINSGRMVCTVLRNGVEFNLSEGKCVKVEFSACSVESPFETLEECQEVCEESEDVIFSDIEAVEKETDSQNILSDKEVYEILKKFAIKPNVANISDDNILLDAIEFQNGDIKERLKKVEHDLDERGKVLADAIDWRGYVNATTKVCIARSIIYNNLKHTCDLKHDSLLSLEDVDDILATEEIIPYFLVGFTYFKSGDYAKASYCLDQIILHRQAEIDRWGESYFIDISGEVYEKIYKKTMQVLNEIEIVANS